MTIASMHVADVGPVEAVRMLRGPGRVPGLVSSDVAIAAPFRTGRLPKPMPGRLALLAFWEDDGALDAFLTGQRYAHRLADGWRCRMELVRAYGTWPGLPADLARSRANAHDGAAVVVTLGRLRVRRARAFLRSSGPAEKAALASPGLLWGTALARPPFVSTLSLWESTDAATAYAYGLDPDAHTQAILADRRAAFHHRSAFVRFRPTEVLGGLGGRNPLPERLLRTQQPTASLE